ncbi:MAG: nucleotidyltransferase family protein, partial [Bacillota bacterium]
MRQNIRADDNPSRKIPSELCLMLACTCCDTTKTEKLLMQPINWNLLIQLAVYHRVHPMVYKTLNQLSNPTAPEHVLDFLRQKYQENALNALSMTGETVNLVKCLEKHGVCAVVLKGMPLAWYLYGDIAIRPSRDIDILVTPDKIKTVQDILKSEGYRTILPEHNLTARQLQILLKSDHGRHFGYRHSKKNIFVELHWKLGHALSMPVERNIKKIEVPGGLLPVLADEEWLLYLILHGADHAWFRLRWLVDIVKFIQRGDTDWKKVEIMAEYAGMQSFLHQGLLLANRLLAVPLPPYFQSILPHDRTAWKLACMAMDLCLATADTEIKGSDDKNIKRWRKIYDA